MQITATMQEWLNSGVDPGIIALNAEEVSGRSAVELILSNQIARLQKVTSYVTVEAARLLRRHQNLEDGEGGWWVSGIDPLNSWNRMEWGQLKPWVPRPDPDKPGKLIKYESAVGEPTRVILLDVPSDIADRVYVQAGVDPIGLDRSIGFWHCVKQYKIGIVIVEGAKKAGAVLTAGYAAIALPGIWNGRRVERNAAKEIESEFLIPDLDFFADGRQVTFCFDQDAKPKTRRAVTSAIRATGQLLNALKCQCRIARWQPDWGKGIDDVAVARGFEAVQAILNQAQTLNFQDESAADPAWEVWHNARRFTPDVTMHQTHFQASLPDEKTLIGIRSGLGTGKTYWLVHTLIEALKDGGFVSVGYRNSLLIQFCSEPGLNRDWYHLQQDLKGSSDQILIRDPNSKIACCIDSLIHFDPQDFDGKTIILDEVESIVKQLLQAKTAVSFHRDRIKSLFVEMLNRADRIICLDGHLTDGTIEYLRSLLVEPRQIIKYLNTYAGNRGRVYFLEGTQTEKGIRKDDYTPIVEAILNNPENIAIASDSQEQLESLDRQLIESGRKTLRFDSTTAREPWVAEFLQDRSGYLQTHQIDALLYSPSAEAGLNVDIEGYFTDLYFLFFGVITTDAQLQMMGRVRDPNADLHVWCTTRGLSTDAVSRNPIPEKLIAEMQQYIQDCAIASLQGVPHEEVVQALAKQLIQLSADDPHFNREATLMAIENHERSNLRSCLKVAIQAAGYQLIGATATEPEKAFMSVHAELKQTIQIERSDALFYAPDISSAEANEKARRFDASIGDRHAIARRRLLDRLPGIETATYSVANTSCSDTTASAVEPDPDELEPRLEEKPVFTPSFVKRVRFDDRSLISKVELHWLLNHPAVAKTLQQMRWHKKLSLFTDHTAPDSFHKLSLLDYQSRWLKISKLIEQGIGFFLQLGNTWHSNSEEAISFWEAGKSPESARAVRIQVGDSSPCDYIGKVLRALGLRTTSVWDSTRKIRVYQLDPDCLQDPTRAAVFDAIGRRFTEIVTRDSVALDWQKFAAAQDKEGSPFPILITNKAEGDPEVDLENDPMSKDAIEDLAELINQCDSETVSDLYQLPNITQSLWQKAEHLLGVDRRKQIREWIRHHFESSSEEGRNAAFAAPT
ncbi:MAG: DUF3854 domain-containing protein [Leptolyngbya sp. Prado105]|jgi:hypothetical protein|nr:DUF3854 domain-containing protein [Leptolyngbya sp. Prado105]